MCVCDTVCVCVFFPFKKKTVYSGRQACCGRTKPGSHRRKVTQEEGHTGFLIHLPSAVLALNFLARRIQNSAVPFPRQP